jgi:hypothetical protein
MVFADLPTQLELNSNELSLLAGLVVTYLFYRQYKKYEEELEREEMIENFLNP